MVIEVSAIEVASTTLRRPRAALYQPWTANSDEVWTEWLLDRYRVPYTLVHNDDFAKAERLADAFETARL